ncbi:MAG: flavodoxin-dependent (E)-4-hydroxy-3-methylbut-2-enyl-diphosphate synthase [Ruminococcaceae bacterium]|nr:flavodoxin-dependent (E)-4-hydroxy-3-methylbut-2-enyl-diphosphate synthase [Oscillospiraceae bacterium]
MFTNATTKKIKVGNTYLGGGSPVLIQSMLSVPSNDFAKNVEQAVRLQNAGCEIIRVSVPDKEAVGLISAIKEKISVPLVADIHFDYRLALDSVAAGVDKVRINPGNIGGDENVRAVAKACNEKNIPIRIGVNSGSLEKEILKKYGSPTPEAMVESAEYHIALLNKFDFDNIVVSLKSSDTKRMYDAYSLLAERYNYPLHLGVTEAGFGEDAIIKSSAAIGGLLLRGIGDTIRISLTDDPTEEVKAAKKLLNAIDLRNDGIRFVSCPTCGRTRINLIKLANDAKERFGNVKKPITVAIMGCVVNGPGEAREADLGIAGGNGEAILFKKGEIIRKVREEDLLNALGAEIEKL